MIRSVRSLFNCNSLCARPQSKVVLPQDKKLEQALEQFKKQPTKKAAVNFFAQFSLIADKSKLPISERASVIRSLLAKAGISEKVALPLVANSYENALKDKKQPKTQQEHVKQINEIRKAILPVKKMEFSSLVKGGLGLLALGSAVGVAYYLGSTDSQGQSPNPAYKAKDFSTPDENPLGVCPVVQNTACVLRNAGNGSGVKSDLSSVVVTPLDTQFLTIPTTAKRFELGERNWSDLKEKLFSFVSDKASGAMAAGAQLHAKILAIAPNMSAQESEKGNVEEKEELQPLHGFSSQSGPIILGLSLIPGLIGGAIKLKRQHSEKRDAANVLPQEESQAPQGQTPQVKTGNRVVVVSPENAQKKAKLANERAALLKASNRNPEKLRHLNNQIDALARGESLPSQTVFQKIFGGLLGR